MWKLIQILTIAVLVNGSYYSFNFAFWASGPNTKMILALFGVLWFLYDSWRGGKGISIPRVLLGGAIFSILYSLVNLIAVEINNTDDYSYANYITTFLVWVFSVYPAIRCIRIVHGEVTISRITYYLVGVTVFQCITGLLNDNILQHRISLIPSSFGRVIFTRALTECVALVRLLTLLGYASHSS